MTADERLEFCCWLSAAEKALVSAQQSKAVTDGRRELRRLRYMFTGADYSHEPDAARYDISGLVDGLVETAFLGPASSSLNLDENIDAAIDSLTKAVDVLRPHLTL